MKRLLVLCVFAIVVALLVEPVVMAFTSPMPKSKYLECVGRCKKKTLACVRGCAEQTGLDPDWVSVPKQEKKPKRKPLLDMSELLMEGTE